MVRTALVSLTLLLGSSFAFPQTLLQQTIVEKTPLTMGANCPVGLQAERRGIGTFVQIKGQPPEVSLRLALHWENLRAKDIVAATLLVRGHDGSPQVIPAKSSTSPELLKTFHLAMNVSGSGKATTALMARSFGTVSWIELHSIDYADGTHWNVSEGESCRIAPSGLLLVAEH